MKIGAKGVRTYGIDAAAHRGALAAEAVTIAVLACGVDYPYPAGHADLFADMAVAAIQGRCLRDDRLVQHQQHGTGAALQPAFEPPFDCRHVSGRRES